jgi:RNA polymerase sigma factor (sigma-70 family)
VYRRFAPDLVRFATGLVGPADGPDVVAEAVMRTMWSRAWPSVHNQRAYLYRAVLNESRSHWRRAMRRRAKEMEAAARVTPDDPPEIRPEVLEAVGRLSSRQKAVVFLTYWDDLRPGEIAGLLGLSEGTVRSHLAKGEKRLRRMLYERA